MDWTCSTHGRGEKAHNISVRKLEGKTPLERHRRRGQDNIRMDLREIVWEGVDWTHLD